MVYKVHTQYNYLSKHVYKKEYSNILPIRHLLHANVHALSAGILLFLACIIYPLGWDSDEVRRICGQDADEFQIDNCGIRWAYILAIIGIVDVLVLAILAFVLAGRVAHKPYKHIHAGGSIANRCESSSVFTTSD